MLNSLHAALATAALRVTVTTLMSSSARSVSRPPRSPPQAPSKLPCPIKSEQLSIFCSSPMASFEAEYPGNWQCNPAEKYVHQAQPQGCPSLPFGRESAHHARSRCVSDSG